MNILETHIVPAFIEKKRLQEYAPQVFKTITTRSGIKKAIKREELLVDGKVGKTSDWVKPKQKLELLQQKREEKKVFQLKLEVIFEDEYLAVVNKPSGYPTSGNYFKTIENALPYNLSFSAEIDALPFPLPVHRLDNPTSGLLLIAKTRFCQTRLSLDFEQKKIRKNYLALVQGKSPATAVYNDDLEGKSSITKIRLLESFKIDDEDFSVIEAIPETGRTHQIRQHLSLHKLPLVGDNLYGQNQDNSFSKGLYLAAVGLEFTHPVSGSRIKLSLPHPKKFQKKRL